MGVAQATFQSAGRLSQHVIPGAYSRVDSVKGRAGLVSATNVVILGRSTGGAPQELLQFNTVAQAIRTLRSGPLMDAVRLAFNPGANVVPQRLFAVRVNNATQSALQLENAATNNMIAITSRDYGIYTRQISIAVADGTDTGKLVTLSLKGEEEVFDNIERESLVITHATATITITNSTVSRTLTGSVGGLSVDFDEYPTIGDVASVINATAGYTATVIAGQESAPSTHLDAVTAVAVDTGPTFNSDLQAMADTLNRQSQYVTATIINGASDRTPVANFATTFLQGGTEGTYDAAAWEASLEMLETEDVQYVTTPDTDQSVHNSIRAHCDMMSSVTGRRERQFLVGGPLGESSTSALLNARALHSTSGGMYVFNGGSQFNTSGVLTEYSAGYAACMLAAIKSGLAINEPLTHKSVNFINQENKLSETVIEQLIKGGVAPIATNSNGLPHVARQITTYQAADLKYNEFSMVAIMNFVSRDLRNFIETSFIGRATTQVVGSVLLGAVEGKLQDYTELGLFIEGEEGAFWNVMVSLTADTAVVDYDANITAPLNFVFVTNHMHTVAMAA